MASLSKKLVVFVLFALFLLAAVIYFSSFINRSDGLESTAGDVRFGSPLETSAETIDLKMEGITFRLPANRLVAMVTESEYWPGEQQSGFSLEVLWPEFEPRTPENIEIFRENTPDWRRIDISVSRKCSDPKIRIDAGGECSPQSSANVSFDVYSSPLVPPGDAPDASAPAIPGMELAGFEAESGKRTWDGEEHEYDYASDIYKRVDENGNVEFIQCGRPERWPSPSCHHRFIWRGYLQVKITYKTWLLPNWQSIKDQSVALLDETIVSN